jgi:ABC-2 type transport system permease protein
MNKVWLILQKELRELLPQRVLLMSVSFLPLAVIIMAGILLITPLSGVRLPAAASDPRLANLTSFQVQQAYIGLQFRMILLFQSLVIPAIIASYSIVGEKNNRTLEPLLAAPVRTWQLMLAKALAALLPAVAVTWLSSLVFSIETALLAGPAVFALVVTPGWLVAVLVTVPVMVMTPIALAVMVSSRVNDPRAASQFSSLLFVVLLFGVELSGSLLVLSVPFTLTITAVFAVLGVLLLWGATRIFQREVILTRWS